MQLNKYLLVLLSISFTVLTIFINKADRAAIANSPNTPNFGKDIRVGYNPQMVQMLGVANRAQQAHYFERGEFSADLQELSESGLDFSSNDNYNLAIETEDNVVFTYGIAQQEYGTYKGWSGYRWEDMKEPLYSYVSSIAYLENNGSFQSILCVSKTIGEAELAKPEINDGKFACAEDTEQIR